MYSLLNHFHHYQNCEKLWLCPPSQLLRRRICYCASKLWAPASRSQFHCRIPPLTSRHFCEFSIPFSPRISTSSPSAPRWIWSSFSSSLLGSMSIDRHGGRPVALRCSMPATCGGPRSGAGAVCAKLVKGPARMGFGPCLGSGLRAHESGKGNGGGRRGLARDRRVLGGGSCGGSHKQRSLERWDRRGWRLVKA